MQDLSTLQCRVCSAQLTGNPVLHFPEAPPAQGFSDSPEDMADSQDLDIHQCAYCGTVQHVLQPVSYYKDVIRAVAFSRDMGTFRRGQLSRWVANFGLRAKNILEVGAGRGEYMVLLKEAGARSVFGLENGDSNLETTKSAGYRVERGYLTDSFENPFDFKFDAFCIFSFMEHWPNINASLRSLHDMLTSDAIGLIEVPSFDYILETKLYSEFTPDHIFYFTSDTLKRVLELNGFEVLEIEPIWHDYILSAIVRRRPLTDFSSFESQQKTVIAEILSFLSASPQAKCAVWGAGHQALSVISLAGLAAYIAFIVDSATFKQGRYTPASRIHIRPPSALSECDTETVLVMAAAYSDEVATEIQREFPQISRIGILREDGIEVVKHA
jgi:SAM-dependent methyltransferase